MLLNSQQDHAERTIRNHLAKLDAKGDLQKKTRDQTGERGRAPEVYYLSDAFKTKLEDFLNKKDMKLGYLNNAFVADPLAEQHRKDDQQVLFAEELAETGERTGVYQLIQLLSADSSRTRLRAISALVHLHEKSAIEPIISMLTDKSEGIRTSAAIALGNIGDLIAIKPLIKACGDPESGVRYVAKEALE